MILESTHSFNRPHTLGGPQVYTSLVNDVPNKIHKQLYELALGRLLDEIDEYDLGDLDKGENESFRDIIVSITEESYSDYWFPSSVFITFLEKKKIEHEDKTLFTTRPRKLKFDLTPYWDNCYDGGVGANQLQYDKNISSNNLTIKKYDYLRGVAIVHDKINDIEYDVSFDELSSDDKNVSDEARLPNDTFTNLYQEINRS